MGHLHSTEQHEPEDEEADHPDAHHEVKVRPVPRPVLGRAAASTPLEVADRQFEVDVVADADVRPVRRWRRRVSTSLSLSLPLISLVLEEDAG